MHPSKVKRWHELPVLDFDSCTMHSLLEQNETEALSCYHIALPAGKVMALAYHKKAVELIWVLEGSGTGQIGSRTVALQKGDSLVIHPPTPHGFTGGPAGMVFLAILSPRVDNKTDFFPCGEHAPEAPKVLSGTWK